MSVTTAENVSQVQASAPAYGGDAAVVGAPPAAMAPIAQASGLQMKKRSPVVSWIVLPVVTLGIYNLVYWYKINKEMRDYNPAKGGSPVASLFALLFSFVLVPYIVTVLSTGDRIAAAQRAAGLEPTVSKGIGLLLAFCMGLHVPYYQSQLNKVTARYGDAPAGTRVPLYN